ncbi:hypothetical protein [Nitrosopumilus piranensis]|uniref:Uncharacterized protein n=1 Tax=Nitrosopumilus piranensis TaxID=1582439 RepID=A0A0C5C8G6_9ARCH|nr:hypothetical protein [Nitrosopumilus piranensis]AJM91522.1 hypothetical protein NPIRD3C_0304 [Nitrosopumilus piranensis]
MKQNVLEKEMHLKELVVKLLKENNLSDYELLDSSFNEIKEELQNHHRNSI